MSTQTLYKTKYFILLLVFFIVSCDIKKSNIAPESAFTAVYHHSDMNASFFPLDVYQWSDGTLTILSGTKADSSSYTWTGTYIMEADSKGKFLWDNTTLSTYVNPTHGLFEKNNTLYFVCMDDVSLQANLMSINRANKGIALQKVFPEIEYPLYMQPSQDGGFLIVSYDRNSRSSVLSKIDPAFNISWQGKYNVNEDAEEKVIFHLSHLGRQFPFFIGEIKGGTTVSHYFVNCFFNYSFSTLMVSAANGAQTGVINGYRYDGAISSLLYLEGDTFAMTRYSFGDNYILPKTGVQVDEISSTNDFTGTKHPELSADARVVVSKTESTPEGIIFTTTTKTGQLVINRFDNAGKWVRAEYLGQSNPVEVASTVNTGDGGMLVLTRMTVAGRFERIALFKIKAP